MTILEWVYENWQVYLPIVLMGAAAIDLVVAFTAVALKGRMKNFRFWKNFAKGLFFLLLITRPLLWAITGDLISLAAGAILVPIAGYLWWYFRKAEHGQHIHPESRLPSVSVYSGQGSSEQAIVRSTSDHGNPYATD